MRKSIGALALGVAILVPVYFAIAALGVKFGLWDWRFGLGTLIVQWGPRILIASLLLGIVALIVALTRRPRSGVAAATAAMVIPALALAYGYHVRSRSADIPPIHDASTNPDDPPNFSQQVMALRSATGANPVHPPTTPLGSMEAYQSPRFQDQASRTVAELSQAAYPDLKTLLVRAERPRLWDALLHEARERDWTIHSAEPRRGDLNATAETFWFGFKDDVAVRVRPGREPGTLLVDARSTSRVGLSDMGTNAARLTDYLASVGARLSQGG